MSSFAKAHAMPGLESLEELTRELGAPPNMPTYDDPLDRLPLSHGEVDVPLEDDDWQMIKVIIDDVIVRYLDVTEHLSVTIEGPLPSEEVDQLAEDLRAKLKMVEKCECRVE